MVTDMDEITSFEGPPEWLDAVARGRADVATGRVVPIDAVIAKVREARDRLRPGAEPETSGPQRGPS